MHSMARPSDRRHPDARTERTQDLAHPRWHTGPGYLVVRRWRWHGHLYCNHYKAGKLLRRDHQADADDW